MKDWVNELAKERRAFRGSYFDEIVNIARTLIGNNRWLEAAKELRALAKVAEYLDGNLYKALNEPANKEQI